MIFPPRRNSIGWTQWILGASILITAPGLKAESPTRPKAEPITISVGDLKGRFSDEARKSRESIIRRIQEFNKALPGERKQGAEDVRTWLRLTADLDDASRKAAWNEHRDLEIPSITKPGKSAREAFAKVLEAEEKKRVEEQERIRREQARAEELRLKAEENQIQAAQAVAQAQQAAALERQAAALERQAEEQARLRYLMEH